MQSLSTATQSFPIPRRFVTTAVVALAVDPWCHGPCSAMAFSRAQYRAASCRSSTTFGSLRSFKTCPPPRFDGFSERLVGGWTTTPYANDDSLVEVEEVMRSCGGAVQGIREPSIGSGDNDNESVSNSNSIYLNRANDGFCFFGDGSYSMGPLALESGSNSGGDSMGEGFLSCLWLPVTENDNHKRRIVIEASHSASLPKAAVRTRGSVGDGESLPLELYRAEGVPKVEQVSKLIRCRMPSESQPWMIQRAKWEELSSGSNDPEEAVILEKDNDTENSDENKNRKNDPFRYWVATESEAEFCDRIRIELGDDHDGHCFVHFGAVCPNTNNLWMVARRYRSGSDGGASSLRSILYVEGTATPE
ncbi:unnamed protein product [Pseudo-nitzschia multistriata]|uniref:Uncharacterized protein n=1 Tax=Pseudo-nitzschia multistriata TaxID=183589 RepID=A0A448ZFT7_9STRA|nr:unnamed protein product [Pseudo-nitzschia multistriata]